jgi:mannose-6-phosphate isomerase-like protein (cupin superfamily)
LAFAQTPSSEGTKKKGFVGDISDLTEKNSDYRRVLYTGKNMQLVLMSLRPGEEIGEETHDNIDQFFRFEEGSGEVVINGQASNVKGDYAVVVPAGARHNVRNTGTTPLRLYTIYAPPEHKDQLVHATRQDAKAKEAHFDGKITE